MEKYLQWMILIYSFIHTSSQYINIVSWSLELYPLSGATCNNDDTGQWSLRPETWLTCGCWGRSSRDVQLGEGGGGRSGDASSWSQGCWHWPQSSSACWLAPPLLLLTRKIDAHLEEEFWLETLIKHFKLNVPWWFLLVSMQDQVSLEAPLSPVQSSPQPEQWKLCFNFVMISLSPPHQ